MIRYLLIDGPNNNYVGLILLLLFLAFVVPIILLIIGIAIRTKRKKASNIIFILLAVYAIVGLGVCGSMMI